MNTNEIETPSDMAERLHEEGVVVFVGSATKAIHARDAQVAEWCKGKAKEADAEAEAHEAQRDQLDAGLEPVSFAAKTERIARCEGQAVAFRALAKMLGGGA